MKILIVEDDADIARIVLRSLSHDGHNVDWEVEGLAGLLRAAHGGYDCIILDWMLPGKSGVEVCRELRRQRVNTPILLLTARDQTPDKVMGLDSGADDYLSKPFELDELGARVRALARREATNRGDVITVGQVDVNIVSQRVFVEGCELSLTRQEYLLLEALVRYQGRTLSREFILSSIWNAEDTTSNSVDVHIASLRRKLSAFTDFPGIRTVHREGYCLTDLGVKAE